MSPLIGPLLGAHRAYSISLPADSPLKCVPTTLHIRKNSEVVKQKQDYMVSPRDLVENARKEATILENGQSAIH